MEKSGSKTFQSGKNRKVKIYTSFEESGAEYDIRSKPSNPEKKPTKYIILNRFNDDIPVKYWYSHYRTRISKKTGVSTSEYRCINVKYVKREGRRQQRIDCCSCWVNNNTNLISVGEFRHGFDCMNKQPDKKRFGIRQKEKKKKVGEKTVISNKLELPFYQNVNFSKENLNDSLIENDVLELNANFVDVNESNYYVDIQSQDNRSYISDIKDQIGIKRKRFDQTEEELEKLLSSSQVNVDLIHPSKGFSYLNTYVQITISFVDLTSLAFVVIFSPEKLKIRTDVVYGLQSARVFNCKRNEKDFRSFVLETLTPLSPSMNGNKQSVDVFVAVSTKSCTVKNGFTYYKEQKENNSIEDKYDDPSNEEEGGDDNSIDKDIKDFDNFVQDDNNNNDIGYSTNEGNVDFDYSNNFFEYFCKKIFENDEKKGFDFTKIDPFLKSMFVDKESKKKDFHDFSKVDPKKLKEVFSLFEGKSDKFGYDLTIHLVGKNLSSVLNILLESKKYNSHHIDMFGNSALHWAIFLKRNNLITLLKNNGFDSEIKNSFGMKPSDFTKKNVLKKIKIENPKEKEIRTKELPLFNDIDMNNNFFSSNKVQDAISMLFLNERICKLQYKKMPKSEDTFNSLGNSLKNESHYICTNVYFKHLYLGSLDFRLFVVSSLLLPSHQIIGAFSPNEMEDNYIYFESTRSNMKGSIINEFETGLKSENVSYYEYTDALSSNSYSKYCNEAAFLHFSLNNGKTDILLERKKFTKFHGMVENNIQLSKRNAYLSVIVNERMKRMETEFAKFKYEMKKQMMKTNTFSESKRVLEET